MNTANIEASETHAEQPHESPPSWKEFYVGLRQDLTLLTFLVALVITRWLLQGVLQFLERNVQVPLSYNRDLLAIMNQLLEAAECDRVVLGLFKVGDCFRNGWCYVQMHLTHEVCRPQISRLTTLIGQVELISIADELKVYQEQARNAYLLLVTHDVENADCRAHLQRIGTTAIANYLVTHRQEEIGIISLQYCYETSSDRLRQLIHRPRVGHLTEQMRAILINDGRQWYQRLQRMVIRKNA